MKWISRLIDLYNDNIFFYNLLQNPGFEEGPPTSGYVTLSPGDTSIDGRVVTRGTIDYNAEWQQWHSYEGEHSLDLNGHDRGGIAQTFATTPGERYLVFFEDGAHPGAGETRLVVTADGQEAHYTNHGSGVLQDMNWKEDVFTFTADDTRATLEFYSDPTTEPGVNDYPNGGPALDYVKVIEADWLFT